MFAMKRFAASPMSAALNAIVLLLLLLLLLLSALLNT
jgi:hypothetical protein